MSLDTNTSKARLRRLWKQAAERDCAVWWRHDVDYDLECALEMALLERKHGVLSTFFFLADAYDTYRQIEVLRKIVGMGHEIAPHVDLQAPRDAVFTDVELFDACTDAQDRLHSLGHWDSRFAVSFHQPPRNVVGRDIPGFESAQSEYWQGKQTGDSRGVFHLAPEALMRQPGPVQINLHPEWWFWPRWKQISWRVRESAKP